MKNLAELYPHYHKDVSHLLSIDVYRVLVLFAVTDPAIAHAIKKLLVPGGRGAKGLREDIKEARDTLDRKLQMMDEDKAPLPAPRLTPELEWVWPEGTTEAQREEALARIGEGLKEAAAQMEKINRNAINPLRVEDKELDGHG